jgi:hypothetical protein
MLHARYLTVHAVKSQQAQFLVVGFDHLMIKLLKKINRRCDFVIHPGRNPAYFNIRGALILGAAYKNKLRVG